MTALHYAEYVARVPNKRRTRWDYLITGASGPEHMWIDCLDDADGIAECCEDYFTIITNSYVAEGRARQGRVGFAVSELISAADFVAFGAAWMEQTFS